MADLRIRNIDDGVVVRLRGIAQQEGYNALEPFLRDTLTQKSEAVMRESYEVLGKAMDEVWGDREPLPAGTVTSWIREDRDARG